MNDHPKNRREIIMDDVQKALDKELMDRFEEVNSYAPEYPQRKTMTDDLVKLYQLRIEEKKVDQDIESARFARKFKLGLETASIVIPSATVIYSVVKGFKFEETGSIVSNTMRRVLGYIKPDKIIKMIRF